MSGVWLNNLQFQFPEVPIVPGTNFQATDVFSELRGVLELT